MFNIDPPSGGALDMNTQCSVQGCIESRKAKGLCGLHYMRMRNGIPSGKPNRLQSKSCDHSGCDKPLTAKGLCRFHYARKRMHSSPSLSM